MRGSAMLAAAMVLGMAILGITGCSDPAGKLNSSNPDEVIAAIRAVAQRGSDEDVDLLADMTANKEEIFAKEAVRGIGSIQRPKAVEALRRVASVETRESIRAEAVLQLAHRPDAETAELLRKIVLVDPAPAVRAAAVGGIETRKVHERSCPPGASGRGGWRRGRAGAGRRAPSNGWSA